MGVGAPVCIGRCVVHLQEGQCGNKGREREGKDGVDSALLLLFFIAEALTVLLLILLPLRRCRRHRRRCVFFLLPAPHLSQRRCMYAGGGRVVGRW